MIQPHKAVLDVLVYVVSCAVVIVKAVARINVEHAEIHVE